MAKFVIITDAASDLSKEYRYSHNVDYVKMNFSFTDETGQLKEYQTDLDWENISFKEFYDTLRKGTRIFTSQVSIKEYLDVFSPYLEKGLDILYVACSSGLSASINTAIMLADGQLKEDYPNNRVVVFDTLRAGMSQGSIVQLAVSLQKEGKSIDEIVEILEKEKRSYKEIGIPETLSYLKRAGRVSAGAAFFGNMVRLKPILVFDEKGSNIAVEKAVGRKAAYKRMAEMIKQDIVDPENQEIYLMHADCPKEDIEGFKSAVLKEIKVKNVVVEMLGPVIGASSGPGTIIVNYKGKQ